MLLLHPLRPHLILPLTLGLGLGLTATTLHLHLQQRRRPLLCEPASSPPPDALTQQYLPQARKHDYNNKSTTTGNIIRQLSLGSVLGVAAGAAVSTFSRVLAVLVGLGVVVVQVCDCFFFLGGEGGGASHRFFFFCFFNTRLRESLRVSKNVEINADFFLLGWENPSMRRRMDITSYRSAGSSGMSKASI